MCDRYDEEMPSGICSNCGEACTAVMRDVGIGSYEYWGARGVHHDLQAVSPCCEQDVVDGDARLIRSTVHVARRDHKSGKVKKGDRYRVKVIRHWRRGGPGWITQTVENMNPARP